MLKALKIAGGFVGLVMAALIITMSLIPPFSPKKLQALHIGMTPAEVEIVWGKPHEKSGDGTMWYYNPRRPSLDVLILRFDETNRLQSFIID
jgi:hypothetical protein